MPPNDDTSEGEREAQARAERVAACEAEVWAALLPILARHCCRLVTVQAIIDGRAGLVQIRVAANE